MLGRGSATQANGRPKVGVRPIPVIPIIPTITVGTVTALASTALPTVTVDTLVNSYSFNFGIPTP